MSAVRTDGVIRYRFPAAWTLALAGLMVLVAVSLAAAIPLVAQRLEGSGRANQAERDQPVSKAQVPGHSRQDG